MTAPKQAEAFTFGMEKVPATCERSLTVVWKCGNEFAPYHHQASHVNPDHRDGWNACYRAAQSALLAQAAEKDAVIALLRAVYEHGRSMLRFNGIDSARVCAAVDAMDDAIECVKMLDGGATLEEIEEFDSARALAKQEAKP